MAGMIDESSCGSAWIAYSIRRQFNFADPDECHAAFDAGWLACMAANFDPKSLLEKDAKFEENR